MTNPLFLGVINTILNMERVCPKCGKPQIVARKSKNTTIKCNHCGADIPPLIKKK